MQIKDLKPRMSKVDIVVEVSDIGDAREFSKFGKPGRVATAIAKDETGTVKLTLWNEQIDNVGVGNKVHIKNGFVSEWQGEMQLTTGRMGTIEVVGAQKKLGEKEEKKAEPEKEEAAAEKEPEKEKEEWITPEEKEEDFEEEKLDVDEETIG
jgi:replication factor A1